MPNETEHSVAANHASAEVPVNDLEVEATNDLVTPAPDSDPPGAQHGLRAAMTGSRFRPQVTPIFRSGDAQRIHESVDATHDAGANSICRAHQLSKVPEAPRLLWFLATSVETFVEQDKQTMTCGAYVLVVKRDFPMSACLVVMSDPT